MLNQSTGVLEECKPDDVVGKIKGDIEDGRVTKSVNVCSIAES